MKTAVLQIRLDAKLKKQSEAVFAKMGFDTTTAIRIFLKQCVIRKYFPLKVVAEDYDPFYSEENQKRLREAMADVEAGRNLIIKTDEELFGYENKQKTRKKSIKPKP